MNKKSKIIILSILTLPIMAIILFSPYGKHSGFVGKTVVVKTIINAKPNIVYNYLGDSDNAEDWSVFVDHIKALNTDQFPDGMLGSSRICFQSESEQGIYWKETILINEKNERRRLNIYDMHGFSLQAKHLLTEQIFKDVGGKCELMFTLFFEDGKSSWVDELKMYYAAYFVQSIFEGNLAMVKTIVDNGVVLGVDARIDTRVDTRVDQ